MLDEWLIFIKDDTKITSSIKLKWDGKTTETGVQATTLDDNRLEDGQLTTEPLSSTYVWQQMTSFELLLARDVCPWEQVTDIELSLIFGIRQWDGIVPWIIRNSVPEGLNLHLIPLAIKLNLFVSTFSSNRIN